MLRQFQATWILLIGLLVSSCCMFREGSHEEHSEEQGMTEQPVAAMDLLLEEEVQDHAAAKGDESEEAESESTSESTR